MQAKRWLVSWPGASAASEVPLCRVPSAKSEPAHKASQAVSLHACYLANCVPPGPRPAWRWSSCPSRSFPRSRSAALRSPAKAMPRWAARPLRRPTRHARSLPRATKAQELRIAAGVCGVPPQVRSLFVIGVGVTLGGTCERHTGSPTVLGSSCADSAKTAYVRRALALFWP